MFINCTKLLWKITGKVPAGYSIYAGPYHDGEACYTYFDESHNVRRFDGPFRFLKKSFGIIQFRDCEKVRGQYEDSRKTGLWKYYSHEGRSRAVLTVNYNHGHMEGELLYHNSSVSVHGKRTPASVKCFVSNGKVRGPFEMTMGKTKLAAQCDSDGFPHGEWRIEYSKKGTLVRVDTEVWEHGRLRECTMFNNSNGRTETINGYMRQQFNFILSDFGNRLLSIVRKGDHDGRLHIYQHSSPESSLS